MQNTVNIGFFWGVSKDQNPSPLTLDKHFFLEYRQLYPDIPGKLATELDILNNTGCPLGGTSASPKGGQSSDSPIINNDKNNPKKEAAGFTAFPVPFKDKLVIKNPNKSKSNRAGAGRSFK